MILPDQFLVARLLLLAGLGVGLLSWRESVNHIGNADFLVERSPAGPTHGWYHVFREVCGDLSAMTVLLLVFFGPPAWRTGFTWIVAAILMAGYYAPFWIGKPFLPALSAPNRAAAMIHLAMAGLAVLALALASPVFWSPAELQP